MRARALLLILAALWGRAWAQQEAPFGRTSNARTAVDGARIDAVDGIDCSDTSDSTATINAVLAASQGKTIVIPSGCRLGVSSPGASAAAITVPAHTIIYCQDSTAGFQLQRQYCNGGRYPGAACASSAECLGGGTCVFDFGSSTFAPSGGSTYTVFKDSARGNMDAIQIYNCSVWTGQADPYQRCVGSTNAGDPCRQECAAGSPLAGSRCDVDSECVSGTCNATLLGDCSTAGGGTGTCTGAPHSTTGAGKINVFDFQRTSNVRFAGIGVYDHFSGDFTAAVGPNARIEESNFTAEVTDCTSPFATPPDSLCFSSSVGQCCYGAANNPFAAANKNNTQPAVAVTIGLVVKDNARLFHVKSRGSALAISAAAQLAATDVESTPLTSAGPGSFSAGISAGANAVIENFRSFSMGSGLNGVALTGANSKVSHSNIQGLAGAGIGITSSGNNNAIDFNTVVSGASTGTGIQSSGWYTGIEGNKVTSAPVDTLQNGIIVSGGNYSAVEQNRVERPHDYAFVHSAAAAKGNSFVNNKSVLNTSAPTASLQPQHYLLSGGLAQQVQIIAPYMEGGWRGVTSGNARTDGLLNVNVVGMRAVGLAGAPFAASGSGSIVQMSYANGNRTFGSLTCDATCTGGNKGGALCFQDSDCSSCNPAVKACIPEPLFGYIGTPYGATTGIHGASHPTFVSNLMFNGLCRGGSNCQAGDSRIKQCTGTTTWVGSQCTTVGNTCGGGGTCSGSSPPGVCTTGTEVGALCCPGASPTCGPRTDTPMLRVVDDGSSDIYQDALIGDNQIFGGSNNMVAIDLLSSGTVGNIQWINNTVSNNHVNFTGGGTFFKFPATVSASGNLMSNNNTITAVDYVNVKGTYGNISFPPKTISLPNDQTGVTPGAGFVDITDGTVPLQLAVDANRSYFFTCEITYASTQADTGVAFAMKGPSSPVTFTYISRIPTATVATGSGSDAMTEQEGNGDDATSTASSGVGTANTKYMANVRGTLVTTSSGNLTARVRAENGGTGTITIVKGSSCVAFQVP